MGKEVVASATAQFSLLPVARWHDLPNEEKRRLGITGGAGLSVIRAGREIDYGWLLFGKRSLQLVIGERFNIYQRFTECHMRLARRATVKLIIQHVI